ncbi:MAG: hypothetical protein ABSF50_20410 [Burkholderiaceae bacterium]
MKFAHRWFGVREARWYLGPWRLRRQWAEVSAVPELPAAIQDSNAPSSAYGILVSPFGRGR